MSIQSNESKREKFEIVVDEHAVLPTISKTAYLSTVDFCKLVSELFRGVFADFEGCIFESGGMEPTISLLFNHGQYDDDATCACERAGGNVSGSSIIDRTRNRDRQLAEGDRYYLTEDGKDAIGSLLTTKAYNTGNPNWKTLTSEWQDRSVGNMYNYGQLPQYTKISNVSIQRLCSLLYGNKDANGEYVEYDVRVATPIIPAGAGVMPVSPNYILTITTITASEVAKIYEKLGYSSVGANIVRA